MVKEETRTQRFCAPKYRWKLEKKRAPRAKQRTARRDLDQE